MKCKLKKEWIDVEMEHNLGRKMAKKIATDHVKELGCKYYPALIRMERRLKK